MITGWNLRIALLTSIASVMAAPSAPTSAQQQKPNILFILADNIGYGDIGAYGGGELRGAPTPRIDRLAAESLRLTQFLVEPSCTPSRAALMTGRYSIRSGLSLVAVPGLRSRFQHAKLQWRRCCGTLVMPPRSSASGILGRSPTVSRRTKASMSFTVSRLRTPGMPSVSFVRVARPKRLIFHWTRGRTLSRRSGANS